MQDLEGAIQTTILDKDGKVITELGGENREMISEQDVPQTLKDAVTSIEDKRFYTHIGIDPIRIAGSFVNNLKSSGARQGGSTITQQLIKLSVFSTKEVDQTYKRKAQEAVLALKIEREFSKEQILTYYLNKVYMSNNVYGFGTASEYYYGKPLNQLSLPQIALLAGMPQAPNSYNPYTNPDNAKYRRDIVLQVMNRDGKITEQELTEAENTPITDGLISHDNEVVADSNDALVFDSLISTVLEEVADKTGLDPYNDGLTIETTVDSGAQRHLYNVLNTRDYINYVNNELQAAAVLLDSQTGEVRAISGGRNQTQLLTFNRATKLNRSTGSTIKPIMDYGPAIEYLDYSTGHTFIDQPTKYSSGKDIYNWDRKYFGAMTMRRALYLSRNTTALQAFREVGNDNITAFLKKLDITVENDGKDYLVESNSINTPVSPLKLAAAFGAFSNYGNYSKPHVVTKITTRDGETFTFDGEQTKAMKDSTAYMITDILKDSFTKGFATDINIPGLPQAGKTGSSNYTEEQLAAMGETGKNIIPDSWMAGYTPNYVATVWVGYDDPYVKGHGVDATEQTYAKKIYYQLMSYISRNTKTADWVQPDSVEAANIEVGTIPLSLPGALTPASSISRELFVKGTIPNSYSTNFGKVIPAPTGVKASYDQLRKELTVNWDPYQVPAGSNEKPVFSLVIGSQELSVTDKTSAIFSNITEPHVTLSMKVTVGKDSSNTKEFELELFTEESSSESSSESESSSSSEQHTPGSSSDTSSSEPAPSQEPNSRPNTPNEDSSPNQHGQ
ncbi:transglycosylase domain-containing protein [Granulicatella balaenopterae]|nr:PBP1A family penicillin-binding protein [Granulicatella balaenopterae]